MRRSIVVRDLGRFGRAAVIAVGVAGGVVALTSPARAQFFWDHARFSADDVARIAMQHGFHPLARPFRNDDVYLADVVDDRGRRQRLVFNAESGEILQRFVLDEGQRYRRYADPSIPRGPIPPARIPNDDNQPGFFSRLFSGNDDATPPQAEGDDIPVPVQPRAPRVRRPRFVEQTPETVHQTPVESAPLAPAAPRVTSPHLTRTPVTSPAAPAEAALPPAASPPAPAAPPTPSDRPMRSISKDPLAIPGNREADAPVKAAPAATARAVPPAAPPKPAAPVKEAVPVAPLE